MAATAESTSATATAANGKISRGKYTFVTRFVFAVSEVTAKRSADAVKFHTSNPQYANNGYGTLVSMGATRINTWLAAFPGRYAGLALGTNDANGCNDPTAFYNNYVTMVQAVIAAGKVPIVPTIPWARTANIQSCGPSLNAKIQQLYSTYPQIVHGPDLWQFFSTHQNLISGDNLHPSEAGYVAYRQQWADAMVANVYGP